MEWKVNAAEILQLVIQGGSGLVALFLAIQLKRGHDNHEIRITLLEDDRPYRQTKKKHR